MSTTDIIVYAQPGRDFFFGSDFTGEFSAIDGPFNSLSRATSTRPPLLIVFEALRYPQDGHPSEKRLELPVNSHTGHLTASNCLPHEGHLVVRKDTGLPQFSQ